VAKGLTLSCILMDGKRHARLEVTIFLQGFQQALVLPEIELQFEPASSPPGVAGAGASSLQASRVNVK